MDSQQRMLSVRISANPRMSQARGFSRGALVIAGSALAYSLAGYFTRLITLDVWTILFWRGLFGGVLIGAYVIWQHRVAVWRTTRAMGWPGVWITLLSTIATICFIVALRYAAVAEVMTIHASIPFLTAILASVFTGEKEPRTTWAACTIAVVGVAVMFDPTASGTHVVGYASAGIMVLSYAAMMVVVRQHRHVSMLPATCLSAFLCALVVLPAAHPFTVSASDMINLASFGGIQFGLGLLLLTLGTRLISATSSALIGSMENPAAPLWVWLAFGEQPTHSTLTGGAVVMAAVIGDVLLKSIKLGVVSTMDTANERDQDRRNESGKKVDRR